MFFGAAGPTATTWVDDIGTFLVASVLTVGAFFKARASAGRGRSGWTWMTAAAASWTLGEAIWGWYAVVRAETVPSPSLADVFYLGAVPLAVVGIALLSANPGQLRTAFRSICDGLIIAGSLLFISWSTALGVVYGVGGGSTLSRAVDIGYPATDIVLCTAALSALSRVARSRGRELGLMGLGLLAFAIADSAYTYFTYTNSYGNGNIFDTGYIVGYLLIFLATLVPPSAIPSESRGREVSTGQTMLPYVPLGLAVVVTVVKATTGGRFDSLLVVTGAITVSLVLVRQLLTVAENSRLARRLQSTVGELRARESELAHQASHDPLTGLANRILFADRVDHALLRQQRDAGVVALMVCDLDDFKAVNDTLGHLAGDEVLRAVAERLTSCTRRADTIARLGGDEFGVLLEDLAQPDSALETATRITEAVRPPLMVAGHQVLITISVGIALASETCDATEQLLRAADVALYEAKAAGKDRFEVFDSQMLTDVFSRIALKADLAILAERPEQLELHYQPIVEIRTGKITGLETLVRWQHPKRGLLYPDAFIKSAEETGAIAAIGAAILEQACEQFSLWRVRGIDCQNISVNLSARQLREPDLVATVKGALNRHGMSPDQLTLEVTETIMMLDAEKAIERLHELKTLGVEIAIDDFGTGYSSFEYLRRLPVDTLKIDRTFTSELGRDSNTVVLVDLMNQLAHAVGLRTVVEGVETEEQLQTVRLLACDEAQGYLVARPAAAAAIEELISRGTWDGATTGLREMTAQLRG